MIERHLQEIEIVSVNLESLKALIGLSQIEDDDWEGIANILNEYSFRLRSAVDGVRSDLRGIEPGRRIPRKDEMARIGEI